MATFKIGDKIRVSLEQVVNATAREGIAQPDEAIEVIAKALGLDPYEVAHVEAGRKSEPLEMRVAKLTPQELREINQVLYKMYVGFLERGYTYLANIVLQNVPVAIFAAQVAKATFDNKPISTRPSENQIGVDVIFPQVIKYTLTPDDNNPAYSDYIPNTWRINLKEPFNINPISYLLGDATHYWKPSNVAGSRFAVCIFKGGIIERGGEADICQFLLEYEGQSAVVKAAGLDDEIPVNENVYKTEPIYSYAPFEAIVETPALYGVKLGVLSRIGKEAVIELLGLVYYEYRFVGSKPKVIK